MNKIRKGFISSHVAFVYEDICREKMWGLSGQDTWPFYFSKIGRYWDSKTEIDVVALDPDGKNMILGECKYWKDPVGINILRDLEEKSKAVNWNKASRKTWYVLFSSAGFTTELETLAEKREDVLLVGND